jgi:phosphoribosyl-ATP pyrophosphohydrolase/phosphoribosyl-AMP cyclohydrolase
MKPNDDISALSSVRFDDHGLVPAIVQDMRTRTVLMLAYMNEESLRLTREQGETWFWSRSRQELWHKGETTGNRQKVIAIHMDCDSDTLLILVEPAGPACHSGAQSCFAEASKSENLGTILDHLYATIKARDRDRPEGSYTSYLLNQGLDKILKKIGEESVETIVAAKNTDVKSLISESSDLIYHLLVLLVKKGVLLDGIAAELRQRTSKNR